MNREQDTWYGVAMGMGIGSLIAAVGFSLPIEVRGWYFAIAYVILTFWVLSKIYRYRSVEAPEDGE